MPAQISSIIGDDNEHDIRYQRRLPASSISNCDIIKDQKLAADVRAVLDMKGPVVCDVNVLTDEVRAPRLQSYQRADGSFISKPIEDLFPFLPSEEFLANMIVKPLPE